jgi:hypothetical protein
LHGSIDFASSIGLTASTVEAPALAWEDAMLQADPWEKAADCERALRLSLDPVHRENLTNIREFWISLATKRPFLSEREFALQVEAISRFHANLSERTTTRSI